MSTIKEFKKKVDNLEIFFIDLESKCFNFDSHDPTLLEQLEFLNIGLAGSLKNLDTFFIELSLISKGFVDVEYVQAKQHIRNKILKFIDRYDAPLNRQICQKPLGYPGDFVVTNLIYEDGYYGFTTFGKFIDRYTLTNPLSRGHVNRRRFFRELLGQSIAERLKRQEKMLISSYACGPSLEVFDIIRNCKNIDRLRFNLIDGEKQLITQLISSTNTFPGILNNNIFIYHENILNLVRKNKSLNEFCNQDIIYCAGFMDYLSDRTAVRLVEYLFKFLAKDGLLILVNVSKDVTRSVYMEMIGDWYLHYRDKEELKALARNIKDPKALKVVTDDADNHNLYLVIGK